MEKKRCFTFCMILALSFVIISCSPTEPEEEKPDPVEEEYHITLTPGLVGITDLYLNISIDELPDSNEVNVFMNDSLVFSKNMDEKEETIFLDDLSRGLEYKFKGVISVENEIADSALLTITTLDETSAIENFTVYEFEADSFCSSHIFDIEILSENEIFIATSNKIARDSCDMRYGIMRWDGEKWDYDVIIARPGIYDEPWDNPLYFVEKFENGEIVAGNSGTLVEYKNGRWEELLVIHGNPNKIWHSDARELWGTSSDNLYMCGENGYITYFNGSDWSEEKIAGDNILKGITGTGDGKHMITFYTDFYGAATGIYHYHDSQWELVYDETLNLGKFYGRIEDVAGGKGKLFALTEHDYILRYYPDRKAFKYLGGNAYLGKAEALSVTEENDIYLCGYTRIFHFNGLTILEICELPGTTLIRIDSDENMIVVGGNSNGYPYPPVIAIGYK